MQYERRDGRGEKGEGEGRREGRGERERRQGRGVEIFSHFQI